VACFNCHSCRHFVAAAAVSVVVIIVVVEKLNMNLSVLESEDNEPC
jgi:hypothetical protein